MNANIIGKRAVVEVGSRHVRMKPESEWFKIPDHHPAIISAELYEQVNARIRRLKCPKKPRDYVLRAKVYCGCCRHAMQFVPRLTKAFTCHYTKVDESAECHNLEIGEAELENLLFEVINKQAQTVLNIVGLDETAGLSVKAEQQAEYERQIAKLIEEKYGLYERYVLRELNAEEYKTAKAGLDTEHSRLSRILNSVKAESAALSAAKASADELRSLADTALGASKLTRPLADLLIEKVYVYPGNRVEIAWKAADFGAANGGKALGE
jgi:hypothetical protein